MPRNVAKPLSATESAVQRVRQHDLSTRTAPVTLSYVKRDGTTSSSTGTVTSFSGTPGMDTGSVTLDTPDKGSRTINLHRITSIR